MSFGIAARYRSRPKFAKDRQKHQHPERQSEGHSLHFFLIRAFRIDLFLQISVCQDDARTGNRIEKGSGVPQIYIDAPLSELHGSLFPQISMHLQCWIRAEPM